AQTAASLRARHWAQQRDAGLDFVSVGDFAYYDQVLNTSALVGAIPERFRAHRHDGGDAGPDLDTLFLMARGRSRCGCDAPAAEMTKWFDTNYHYLVPELSADQQFSLSSRHLHDEVREAQAQGHTVKAVILGPLTYLWLSKTHGAPFDRLTLLDRLLPVYARLLQDLAGLGVGWVQIDEPILALDLPAEWQAAFESAYNRLQTRDINILIASYFGPLADNLWLATRLPVAGLHIDVTRSGDEWRRVIDNLSEYKVLSLGLIDARNIWRADLGRLAGIAREAHARLGQRLWIASSASLQHVPVDLANETGLPSDVLSWLAFAVQKLDEVQTLRLAVTTPDAPAVVAAISAADAALASRRNAEWRRHDGVRARVASLTPADSLRAPFDERARQQQHLLQLPLLPTTTIGSFPQTTEIRQARAALKAGRIGNSEYEQAMRAFVAESVQVQEALGLDVLVHGEPERNDMVEYFGEQLAGFLFTRNGWVQSYGSRCVKPPIIAGDISRPAAMTVAWAQFAQSLTTRPMKGMLTGPVTILCWSFPRDDVSRETIARQIALAIRDEAVDLEAAGIPIIQIDEPAFREGLPLRQSEQADYWRWAVEAFRLSASGVRDNTQIHTHMCYSDFNDCIRQIAAMDADVITIETARSAMELLQVFSGFSYPNAIGPGVYDIHSPRVPAAAAMKHLLDEALRRIPAERLWVNPDCGLKTRGWPEVKAALAEMVAATKQLRAELATTEASA
ncbi:MAG: 5-methyltetrahydropteroyltriglutamate--homocysteine S-methyltransferase, partial [Perlucidibaca sp.]